MATNPRGSCGYRAPTTGGFRDHRTYSSARSSLLFPSSSRRLDWEQRMLRDENCLPNRYKSDPGSRMYLDCDHRIETDRF